MQEMLYIVWKEFVQIARKPDLHAKFTVDAQSERGCLAGDSKSAAIGKKAGRCFGTGTEYQSPLPLPLKITTCTAPEWPVPVGPLIEAMP